MKVSVKDIKEAKIFEGHSQLRDYCVKSISLEGLILEFGVFEGHTIREISSVVYPKVVYGFDWFKGLPEHWNHENPAGKFNTGGRLPEVPDNVKLVVGLVQDTVPTFLKSNSEIISFVHMDLDLYSSTKSVLNNIKERVADGTVFLFDEFFNYPEYKEHEFKAFNEFLEENNFTVEIIGISTDFYGQAGFILRKETK